MRNLFEDAMYLFDMKMHEPTIIKSASNSNYELHIIPSYETECIDEYFHVQEIGIQFNILILKNYTLCEEDVFNGKYIGSKYFFDYLKWFNDDPEDLIKKYYESELSVAT